MRDKFPKDFLWGAATAAYQIEGSCDRDGRGPSIWDIFCRKPGAICDGSSGATACDSYTRTDDDLALMQELGLKAYRFSIAWPRIFPEGRGRLNAMGLDHYAQFVDKLLKHGIEPFITLYHWDLPQALQDQGGWEARPTAQAFAGYAATVVKTLGDRVRHWITFNEMDIGLGHGYRLGKYAPGLQLTGGALQNVFHHALLAHGLAVQAMRAARSGLRIGIAADPLTPVPVIEDEAHIEACRRAYLQMNGWIMDPVWKKKWPAFLEGTPLRQAGDLDTIAQPLDFLGLNIYSGIYIQPDAEEPGFRRLAMPPHYPQAHDLGWLNIVPPALYWSVRWAREIYAPAMITITENGFATDSLRDREASCRDTDRILYLREYLLHLQRAIREGAKVNGYFAWSLLDNFEWCFGLTKRFGLYYVDYTTQRRYPKLSAAWYKAVIAANRVL